MSSIAPFEYSLNTVAQPSLQNGLKQSARSISAERHGWEALAARQEHQHGEQKPFPKSASLLEPLPTASPIPQERRSTKQHAAFLLLPIKTSKPCRKAGWECGTSTGKRRREAAGLRQREESGASDGC